MSNICYEYLENQEQLRREKIDRAFRTEFASMFDGRKWNGRNLEVEVSVGEGWYGIIHDMCAEIRVIQTVPGSFKWLQLKEKFGTLRAYCQIDKAEPPAVWEEMDRIVMAGERRSAEVCEVCGAPGVQRDGGWIKTLCDVHASAREEERCRK